MKLIIIYTKYQPKYFKIPNYTIRATKLNKKSEIRIIGGQRTARGKKKTGPTLFTKFKL